MLSVVVLASVLAAGASAGSSVKAPTAQVPADLLQAAQAKPNKMFKVIVQGRASAGSSTVASDVRSTGVAVRRKFQVISGVSATLPGKLILRLAKVRDISAITPDVQVQSTDYQGSEMWRATADVSSLWSGSPAVACPINPRTGLKLNPACVPTQAGPAPQAPAIAIVDSGIDASKTADFGNRVVASVNFSSGSPGATGDGEGHGTMVAGIAAGSSSAYPGVARNAPLVSVRTSDATGMSYTSDVIAGIDWILQNKDAYDIRVANFSLAGSVASSFTVDPLDQAVEKLWFNGIVVVAAAGNHGTGTGDVPIYAPGNDPFVITVGALDQNSSSATADDVIAPWSAYGTSADGFHKPDLSAPGRWLIMPVPVNSTLARTMPERIVAPGYMWMSGTSFAAPVVSGAAAQLLARHPDWTPDQVKGALMLSARQLDDPGFTGGVGEVDAAAAASVASPPSPNEGLDPFVTQDPATGQPVFDSAGWAESVASDASWTEASWNDASWAEASWSSASWAEASWNEASWAEASWADASWTEATASEATTQE
ncbi:MAG: S8 family serine peptidase [Gaiellaceae bacterium]